MIVPMQRVTILCTEADRDSAISRLQALGVLHLDLAAGEAADRRQAEAAVADGEEALRLIAEAAAQPDADAAAGAPATATPPPPPTIEGILRLGREAEALEAEVGELDDALAQVSGFGEFDPSAAARLVADGIPVQLFRAPAAVALAGDDAGFVRILAREDHHVLGVAIGAVNLPDSVERIPLPDRPLSRIRARRAEACARHAAINRGLAAQAGHEASLRQELAGRIELRDFVLARTSTGQADGIVWLTGYCPGETVSRLHDAARAAGWALVARDPAPDEEPPTLIRPPTFARPITGLFKMLGILPGYRESDISVAFYAFFTLFFAMLVGDAGYGALLLAGTLALRARFRRAPASPFVLMGVFSVATMIWGVLTSTYFGIPAETLPASLRHPVARWFGNQQNTMQFCFFLGALHLSVARLWNAVALLPSTKSLAQVGWAGIVWTMYAAACMVSVDGFVFPPFMLPVAALSVLLIAFFMLDRSELRTNGVDLGMLPLNIISCLGDIISYVRLFAVGMASIKVAEIFNQMAMELTLPLWAKIPSVLLILLAGHGLNLLMGALSILVHAVRLNTLEFSNHKGVSWSGFAYRPFRRQTPAANATAESAVVPTA